MSSSFVILSRNFLYDRSEGKFCSLVFKVSLEDFFFGVVRVGVIWNNKKLT